MKTKRIFKRLNCRFCALSLSRDLNAKFSKKQVTRITQNYIEFYIEYHSTINGNEFYIVVISYPSDSPPTNGLVKDMVAQMNIKLCQLNQIHKELGIKT